MSLSAAPASWDVEGVDVEGAHGELCTGTGVHGQVQSKVRALPCVPAQLRGSVTRSVVLQ